jgi:type 1 glutamine amidotransferase
MTDFEMDDELYAKLSGDAEIEVLATADSKWSGQTEPMVFVKKYGKGRVVHNVLGHDVKARDNESFNKLLCRGVEWAATGKVTVD